MKNRRIMKNAGFVCILVGISGIAGAIELGTGLVKSVIVFVCGVIILTQICKEEGKVSEKEDNSNSSGNSVDVAMDRHCLCERKHSGRTFPDRNNGILLRRSDS